MLNTLLITGAILAFAAPALGVQTRTWTHAAQEDFEKGKLKNLALRSDGRLSLAPRFTELFDASVSYLWALAEDSKGRIYAGGGGTDSNTAKLFVIEPGKAGRLLAEFEGLEVHALAIDKQDRVYAATSPDGKVWRVKAGGETELFYDPRTKYIWSLVFNPQGDLFVGTGDSGEIHKVTPDGKGSVFYRTEETHARTLAVDSHGNLLAGTEPSGLILRITPSGEGFVLYQAAKREVTAITLGHDGVIFAAAVGNKQPPQPAAAPSPGPVPQPAAPSPAPAQPQPQPQASPRPAPQAGQPLPTVPASVAGGSEIYAIEPDGYAKKLWSHPTDIVYALALDAEGRPLVGTGNKGKLYRLDSALLWTTMLSAAPTQITGLHSARDGRVLAVTGNIGKVYQLGPELEREGTYEGDVLDAEFFSYWGQLGFKGVANGGSVKIETRSGNLDRPQQSWSPWTEVKLASNGGRIASPPARFLQYKLTLAASRQGRSPEVSELQVAWLPRNAAPVVERIEITPPNYRFPPQSLTLTPSQNITLPAMTRTRRPSPAPLSSGSGSGSVSMQYAKGHIGARWLASDPNGDALQYKLEIRGVNETVWKLLKDDLKDAAFSWDSTVFPDGRYLLRITASDAPDNPPDQALSAVLESEEFVIDNTPPVVTIQSSRRAGSKIEVAFRAQDERNRLVKAEYSINGSSWRVVEPTTRLSDSTEHDYKLSAEADGEGEQTIAIRVTDSFDNQAVEKTVVK
jgi:hypothetical protein